jgi:hypothetical protein
MKVTDSKMLQKCKTLYQCGSIHKAQILSLKTHNKCPNLQGEYVEKYVTLLLSPDEC